MWRLGVLGHRLCSCGAAFDDCLFWQAVGRQSGGVLTPTTAERVVRYTDKILPARSLWRLLLSRTRGQLWQDAPTGLPDIVENLYRALADTSGRDVIIDSSKLPTYLFLLAQIPAIEVRVVHLVRDPRAVAHSWSRPVVSDPDGRTTMSRFDTARASLLWLAFNAMTERVVSELELPHIRVRYEDFVRDTEGVLAKVKRFGWGPEDSMRPIENSSCSGQQMTLPPVHIVSGNPMRFQHGSLRLEEDRAWRAEMSCRRRRLVAALTFPLLFRYGYWRDLAEG